MLFIQLLFPKIHSYISKCSKSNGLARPCNHPHPLPCTCVVFQTTCYQVISSRSASMIFSRLMVLTEYSMVTNTIRSTLNTLMPMLAQGKI